MLISVIILWLTIALFIAGRPFEIYLRFRNNALSWTSIPWSRLELFQKGQYSQLFFVSISSQAKETPICMSIGPLLTVLKPIESQETNGKLYTFYNLPSSFIQDFEFLAENYEPLSKICDHNRVLKLYCENNLNPIWIGFDQVAQICGSQFLEKIRLDYSQISVAFGNISNDGGNIEQNYSELIFISESDNLIDYSTSRTIIADRIKYFMQSNPLKNQVREDNQVNHNKPEHILSANHGIPKHSGSHQELDFLNLISISSQTIAHPYSATTCDDVSTELCLRPPRSI